MRAGQDSSPGRRGQPQACVAAHRVGHHNTDVTVDLGDPPRGIAAALKLFGKIAVDHEKGHGHLDAVWPQKRLPGARLPLCRLLDDRPADTRFMGAKVAQPPGPVLGDERKRIAVA